MTTTGLFQRKVAVEIGPEGGAGVRLADLRVSFKAKFSASKAVATATIKIYNPSPMSVGLIRAPLAAIRLLAGYDPLPRLLFQGTPIKGGVSYGVEGNGPDRVLEVEAADGGSQYGAFVQVGFATPTTFGQVLATVLAQTFWARGTIDPLVEATQLPHGIVLQGRPADILDRLAAAVPPPGADWFLRDRSVYVVRRGFGTPEVAPLLSSIQGNLIGSPTGTAIGTAAQGNDGVKVRALIDATMRPGRTYTIQSAGLNGVFVAKEVTFTGDSGWDTPFYMEIDGKPLGVP